MLPTLFYLPLLLTAPSEPPTLWSSLGITSRPALVNLEASRPPTRHFDITLTELDATQVAKLLEDSLPASIRDRLKGRIGKVAVSVRGDVVTLKAEKFRLVGDWLSRAEATADLKTRKYTVKMWAFGGLVEADGNLPKDLGSFGIAAK